MVGFGVGRLGLGAAFLAAPVLSTRVLGLDTATAKRVVFLARMAAARDIGLGAGTLAAGPTPAAVPWLLASAGADLVDASAIAVAMRQRVTGGLPAVGLVVGAFGAAVLGVRAAVQLARRSSGLAQAGCPIAATACSARLTGTRASSTKPTTKNAPSETSAPR